MTPAHLEGARCGTGSNLRPEDLRCVILTLSGNITPCDDDTHQFGLNTLFASHSQMEMWPADHGFILYVTEVIQQ